MKKLCRAFALLFLALSMAPLSYAAGDEAASQPKDFGPTVARLETIISQALSQYSQGHFEEAQGLISDGYFDEFEASGMETAVGARSDSLKIGIESLFNELRGGAIQPGRQADLELKARKLVDQLRAVSLQMSQPDSQWEAAISSFTIILREGFEAILVIGAIVAFLIKTGNKEQLRLVKSAIWTALAASFAMALLFRAVFKFTSAQQELFEGLTMLLACAFLFMIGHWLVGQAESQHWNNYIRTHLRDSLTEGSRRALWLTCFLAVFREGAETVLFYQALAVDAGPRESAQLLGGFAVGCAALAAIYFSFKTGILKIPMRPFFRITSSLLFYLAFVFAGKSVVELQAGGYLLVNEIRGWPTIHALGFYPTVQSLSLQAFMLLLLAASLIYTYALKYRASKVEGA